MSNGPDRPSSSSSALSYLTPPPQPEPPLPEPETPEPEREIAATHADTVTPPEPAAEVVPEPVAEVIPEPDAEAAPEQPEEDSEARQTWLTAASAGLRTLAEASASLQRELGECRRVDDARHAQCTAQHAAKSAGLPHAMETEPGGTLLPQDAGRAAAHEPERDADDHARTGGAAAASPGRDADADARLQEQLSELSALRREKWTMVREFFDGRRRAQQVEHDELVGAINAVRGAARRGR